MALGSASLVLATTSFALAAASLALAASFASEEGLVPLPLPLSLALITSLAECFQSLREGESNLCSQGLL